MNLSLQKQWQKLCADFSLKMHQKRLVGAYTAPLELRLDLRAGGATRVEGREKTGGDGQLRVEDRGRRKGRKGRRGGREGVRRGGEISPPPTVISKSRLLCAELLCNWGCENSRLLKPLVYYTKHVYGCLTLLHRASQWLVSSETVNVVINSPSQSVLIISSGLVVSTTCWCRAVRFSSWAANKHLLGGRGLLVGVGVGVGCIISRITLCQQTCHQSINQSINYRKTSNRSRVPQQDGVHLVPTYDTIRIS